jgi:hypothetical protein
MTTLGRSVLVAAVLAALLCITRPTGATGPATRRPEATQASAVTPVARPDAPDQGTASGSVLWANVGVGHLAHPRPAAERARMVVDLLRDAHATIGLLAEAPAPALRELRSAARGSYGIVSGARRGETSVVLYDTRTYRLDRTVRFRTFGYRGRLVPAPLAVLTDRATGTRIAAMAVHHPANNTRRGSQGRWQRAAWRRELHALQRLRATYAGRISTFLGGDFNERSTCELVARTGLVSPVGTVSSCPTARTRIDQLFADPTVHFDGYHAITSGTARLVTDHAGVYSAVFALRQPA